MVQLVRRYRVEATWLLLLLVLTLLTPKGALAQRVGRLVMEDDFCDDDPLDCWIEELQ